jgi:hypothetical protein
VFVGDVTPVGKTVPYTTDEGVKSDGKLLMNPNVAIELGYALKSLRTERVLMIMNSHYGKRADMPFDLGHKGGPIMYTLAPDASREEIQREKKKLVSVLVDALGMYVPKTVAVPFEGMKPQIGQGIFFKDGEILGEKNNDKNKTKFVMPFRRVMWLRLSPSQALPMPLSLQTLVTMLAVSVLSGRRWVWSRLVRMLTASRFSIRRGHCQHRQHYPIHARRRSVGHQCRAASSRRIWSEAIHLLRPD